MSLPTGQHVAVLIGPTASGKTEVVRELAKLLPLEVINCDSMQVYKGLEVLSQAPSAAVRRAVPHHEVGVLPLHQEYDAARFAKRVRELVPQIIKRGRLPVIVGGTGLYLKAFLDGLMEGPGVQPEIRQRLEERAASGGSAQMHRELTAVDPEAAAKIHPNDARRIIRALEVIEATGKKFSDLKRTRRGAWGEWPIRIWGLEWDRAVLYDRINRRVPAMLKLGARAEAVRAAGKRLSKTARGCLGLREIRSWIAGEITREAALESIRTNTRRYAKRQLTWFRPETRIHWMQRNPASTAKTIAGQLNRDILDWLKEEPLLANSGIGTV
jgi:tRNA dimethylallyltransferase